MAKQSANHTRMTRSSESGIVCGCSLGTWVNVPYHINLNNRLTPFPAIDSVESPGKQNLHSGPPVNYITSQATSGVSRVLGLLLIFDGAISSIQSGIKVMERMLTSKFQAKLGYAQQASRKRGRSKSQLASITGFC